MYTDTQLIQELQNDKRIWFIARIEGI